MAPEIKEPPLSRDSKLLHPLVADRVTTALSICYNTGLYPYIFEGYRSFERSDWLYEQGRSRPGPIVSNSKGGNSLHNYGLAVDIVFDSNPKTPKIDWSWNGRYDLIGIVFEKLGFEWGARWKSFPENAHFQIVAGLSLKEIKSLWSKGGITTVWNTVSSLLSKNNIYTQASLIAQTADIYKYLEGKGFKKVLQVKEVPMITPVVIPTAQNIDPKTQALLDFIKAMEK